MTTTQLHASAEAAPQVFAPPGPTDVRPLLRLIPVAEPGDQGEQRGEWTTRDERNH